MESSYRLLIIDDDQSVLNLLENYLTNNNYDVVCVSNGLDGLKRIESGENGFDLIITDLVMPDMNGKELSEKIIKLYPDIKVLFTSGYTENHLVKSGELENNINFLPKPYTAKSLLTFVRKILKSEE